MIFGTSDLKDTYNVDMNALVEAFLYDDISRGSTEEIKEFCESEAAQVLVEKGVLKKPTLMRLGKEDDKRRRETLACYQLAKESGDPLWKKLAKNRVQEKKLIAAIKKKYMTKARKIATVGQKEYIKVAAKLPGVGGK